MSEENVTFKRMIQAADTHSGIIPVQEPVTELTLEAPAGQTVRAAASRPSPSATSPPCLNSGMRVDANADCFEP